RPVPPRDRRRRLAHRLRRWPRLEALAAATGAAAGFAPRRVTDRLRVDLATIEERDVVARLLELYAHDFSERNGVDVRDDGTYGYRYLDAYWTEPDRHPLLFRVDGRLAGLALVRTGPPIDMAEFFVLRKYRRGGV